MDIDEAPSRSLSFSEPPRRVISLVPSLTESLFDLGLGAAVVGITDYCIYPAEALAGLPRLGGPKNPRVQEIVNLHPDLVLANWEENTRQTVEALEAIGVAVWVTFPQTVEQSQELLWKIAELFRSQGAFMRLQTLELTLEWARSATAEQDKARYFCPVWYDRQQTLHPWFMTFNRQTYCHDLLATLAGENIFAGRERLYPLAADLGQAPAQGSGEHDTRYPRVTVEEVLTAQPEVILLPDEPFAFNASHVEEMRLLLSETPAVRNNRLHLFDGNLLTWHGTRLARALVELPPLLML